jgi:osmotically-inducible protein OsmY
MIKQGRFLVLILVTYMLSGCLGGLWTSANVIYDRHNIYKKIADYQLTGNTIQALHADKKFKAPGCVIDITVFKQNILLAGHVPSTSIRDEAQARIAAVSKNKRIYNQLTVANQTTNTLQDSWITAKIRTKILADSSIDPNTFKVTTTDNIVYLLGEMKTDEAQKVIHIVRNVNGVEKVVKILQYYTFTHLTDK